MSVFCAVVVVELEDIVVCVNQRSRGWEYFDKKNVRRIDSWNTNGEFKSPMKFTCIIYLKYYSDPKKKFN